MSIPENNALAILFEGSPLIAGHPKRSSAIQGVIFDEANMVLARKASHMNSSSLHEKEFRIAAPDLAGAV